MKDMGLQERMTIKKQERCETCEIVADTIGLTTGTFAALSWFKTVWLNEPFMPLSVKRAE